MWLGQGEGDGGGRMGRGEGGRSEGLGKSFFMKARSANGFLLEKVFTLSAPHFSLFSFNLFCSFD